MHCFRSVSGLIGLILLISLVACGGSTDGSSPEPVAQESSSGEASSDDSSQVAASEEASSNESTTEETTTEEEASSDEATSIEGEEDTPIEPVHGELDPARFTNSTNIDNEWMPMQPSMRWVYEGETIEGGESIPHRIEFTVTDLTKEIGGVQTVVAWVVDISDDEIVETEISFYAQDDDGTVWYFGEYPEEYDGGELVASPGWITGQEEARAGIKMVENPQLDMPIYFQGWAPAVDWSDFSIVARLGEEVCVAFDCYENVLVIDESSLEEVGAFQQKYYAQGVGNISVDWTGDDQNKETLELVSFDTLEETELADIHALVIEQDARAYANLSDVYGETPPIE